MFKPFVNAPLKKYNENGLKSTCLSESLLLSKIGTVDNSRIGCAIKLSGDLILFSNFLILF